MGNGYSTTKADGNRFYAPYQTSARTRRVMVAPHTRNRSAGSIAAGLLVVIAMLALCVVAFYGSRGYSMYQEALEATPITAMIEQIEASPGFTPIEELPERYLDAVVAVEDHRFYLHPGFDIIATGRALVNDLKAGSFVEGGSTITQQLAKNQFFSQDRELERKVAEVFMAFDLESKLSKEKILELYVNSIYFGDGYYGIRDASMGYFGKAPSELSDSEATLLAGVPNAPSAYAPSENPELARERQLQVLRQMVEYKMITPQESQEIAEAA
ncbi:transglycosylase domain-containing protein [Raoultibacter phocaeensis]|uniref:transglycosylase domain-containing protein n=1 Tax=Raoultibacter phocaeensis TaxID=2479841 RepID=UPI0021057D86|nr:biosynthetic peptidoglycan transglycosylase [Raoultibacter phocaeensis]